MHPSANNVIFTWGKYKGLSLGYIKNKDPKYLTWAISSEFIPEVWQKACARVLKGEDISDLKLPTAKKTLTIATTEKISNTSSVRFSLVNKNTATVNMPYDKELIDMFKYEVDGRVWNKNEKRWEFPAVQLLKAIDALKHVNVVLDDNVKKKVKELQERRTHLDEIRKSEDTDFTVPGLKLNLFPFQKVGVEFVNRAGGRCLIADQPGLGKTLSSIAYAQLHNLKTIIVCPLSVVLNWKKEIERATGKIAIVWDAKGRVDGQFEEGEVVGKITNWNKVNNQFPKNSTIDY